TDRMTVRDPTPSEVRAFSLIDALLRHTQPKIRRGVLSEIRVPSGTLARSSSGRLSIFANLTTLSTDTLTDRDRKRPRDPDAAELSEWRRVAVVCERFQPALRNGRLQEIVLRDGVLRLAPSGELMAITTTDTLMVADIEVPSEPEIDLEPDVLDEPLPPMAEPEIVWEGRSMLQASNPAAPGPKVGMGRMPRGAFLFARPVRHTHRKTKG